MTARFIALSLALHLAVLALFVTWGFQDSHAPQALAASTDRALQVRSLSEKDFGQELARALDETDTSKTRQIVQSDERLKSERAPETEEKVFLSKTNQAVDRNTRAPRVGKFKNVLEEGVRGDSGPSDPAAGNKKIARLFDIGPHARDLEPLQALLAKTGTVRKPASVPTPGGRAGDGFSATDDHLEGIAVGANTLLNAREFKFYAFYERVREKLSDRWNTRLAAAFQEIWAQSDSTVDGEHITKVQVELDSTGQLKRVMLVGSSGVTSFDRAATDAFREAAPFPNPPKEMIETQGSVRIHWDFVVIATAETGGIQVNVRRGGL